MTNDVVSWQLSYIIFHVVILVTEQNVMKPTEDGSKIHNISIENKENYMTDDKSKLTIFKNLLR